MSYGALVPCVLLGGKFHGSVQPLPNTIAEITVPLIDPDTQDQESMEFHKSFHGKPFPEGTRYQRYVVDGHVLVTTNDQSMSCEVTVFRFDCVTLDPGEDIYD